SATTRPPSWRRSTRRPRTRPTLSATTRASRSSPGRCCCTTGCSRGRTRAAGCTTCGSCGDLPMSADTATPTSADAATPAAAAAGPAAPASRAAPPVPAGARALLAVTVALLVAALVGQVVGLAAAPLAIYRFDSVYVLSAPTAPVLGVLLVRRVPHNPIGWLLLATGAAGALATAAMSFADVLLGSWLHQWTPWLTT